MKKILILLIVVLTFSKNYGQTTIYYESFGNTCSSNNALPSGWTYNPGNGDWLVDENNSCGLLGIPNGPNGGNRLIYYDQTGGTEAVMTGSISTSLQTNLSIEWNEYRNSTKTLTLQIATTSSGPWTTLPLTDVANDAIWHAIAPISIPVGFENQPSVYFQWIYTGTGISDIIAFDDILLKSTPPITTYYWNGVGAIGTPGSWGSNSDGSGTNPPNFSGPGITYNLVNNTTATLSLSWTVSGTSSKINIGNGITGILFNVNAALAINSASMITLNTSTLNIQNSTLPTASANTNFVFNTGSTAEFSGTGATFFSGLTYSNLTLSGGTTKNPSPNGSFTVNGTLNLNATVFKMQTGLTNICNLNSLIIGSGSIQPQNGIIRFLGSGSLASVKFLSGTAGGLTIDRISETLTLQNDLVVSGTAIFTNGSVNLNGKTLTLNGNITFQTSGNFIGSATSAISISTVAAVVTITNNLNFDQTSSSTRSLYDLTLNRSTRTLTIGNSLDIINSITPTSGTIALGSGNVTLKSTSTSKARVGVVGGGFTGTIKVETYIPGGSAGWNNLGPAGVSGLTVANWDGGNGSSTGFAMTCVGCINDENSAGGHFVSIQSDPAGNGVYTELTSTSTLTPGTGYWVYIGNSLTTAIDITQTTSGAVVTGNVTSGTGFMSNPYPSPMSFNSLQLSNPGLTSLDVYDPNSSSYLSYNGGIPGDIIPMGQGFYANGITSVTFRESNKTASNNNMLKTSSTNSTSIGTVFQLKINGWYGDYDNTYVRFHNNATPVFDDLLDAYKRYATPGYLGFPGPYQQYTSIATVNTNQEYAINSLPYAVTSDAVIPVVAKASATGQYTISPVDIQNLPPAACVILKDKLLNINHDLRTGSYVFNMSDTTSAPRFELTICADQTVTSIKQLTTNNNNVIIGQDGASGVFVKTKYDKNTKSVISAYNVMGQKIITDKEIEGSENLVYLDFKDLHNQIVIIKVSNDKGQTTKKVYLN